MANNKEANLKEKFRQALSSTVRVISEDFKIKNKDQENESSKKFDFFELDNLNTKSDFIKARADSDSSALRKKFSNQDIFKKICPLGLIVNLFILLLKK